MTRQQARPFRGLTVASSMSHAQNQIESSLDVLRLSSAEIEQINRELDQKAAEFRGNNRRQDERHPYRRASKMVVTAFHPGGTTTRYLIEPRNISRTGLAFLHGSFLHNNTQLVMSMETLNHRFVNVTGRIVHCKFVRGNVHEVGVRFTQPIDLAHFVIQGGNGNPGELPRLVGRVLCLEPSKPELHLLRHVLERLGVQSSSSVDVDDAVGQIAGGAGFDVVLVGIDGDAAHRDTLTRLREADGELPLVAMTADDSAKRKSELMGKLCNGLLVKPVDAQAVALVLLQYLPLATEAGGAAGESSADVLESTMWADATMRPLILEYLGQLASQVSALSAALEGDAAADALGRALLQIKGSAGSYGYPRISEGAADLRKQLDAGKTAAQLRQGFEELSKMCAAACRVRNDGPG